jgi:hypothetical protein
VLNFDGFPSHLVEDIIWRHAQKGLALLNEQYRVQFTCRCQPVLQMYSLLHFADVIARYFPGGTEGRCKDGPCSIKAGMEILEESLPSFPVAELMQEMLRRRAIACSIRFLENESGFRFPPLRPKKTYQLDDFIHACTRPSYIQPVDEICQRFLPSLTVDWLAHSSTYGFMEPTWEKKNATDPSAEEIGAPGLMQISNLLNADIRAVIGIDVQYTGSKKASVSVWRPDIGLNDTGEKELPAMQTVTDQVCLSMSPPKNYSLTSAALPRQ